MQIEANITETKTSSQTGPCDHRRLLGGEFWQKIPAYFSVSEEQFLDHHWQLKNSITGVKKLLETLKDVVSADFYKDAEAGFHEAPMAVRVTPYVLSLIDWNNAYEDPLRKQFVPLASRLMPDHPELSLDTLHERADSPVPGLTHRYPDKALFLALDTCPVYCRYCTRSYAVGGDTDAYTKVSYSQDVKRYEQIFAYIRSQTRLEDIVVSGGDVYMLRPERIRYICENLLAIPHIRRLRLATKGLAIMPMKILTDHEWYDTVLDMVKKGRLLHKEVCIHTHFSHPNEITEISKRALDKLMEDAVVVRNQAVLQRGVNDSAECMILLARRLGYINVHSYYVYMHDLVKGVEDLRTTLQSGLDIEKLVRGTTAGFNTPVFVVDAPGGGGKREIHSYEHYDRETGISVYSAPSIKPGQSFMYFDPIHTLSPQIQKDWSDPGKGAEMKAAVLEKARSKGGCP